MTQRPVMPATRFVWRGLGGWNFYFLIKFALLWFGYLNFHPLSNLVLLAGLLLPIRSDRLHRLRNGVAIPVGIGLFWHDTWLPGPESIASQGSQLTGFSASYLLELANRFINWEMVGTAFVMLVLYLFISQWVRITVLVSLALLWLNVVTIALPPLGERREDIVPLFEHFLLDAAVRYQRPAPILTDRQRASLMQREWPGNVRELRNAADRFVLGVADDPVMSFADDGIATQPLKERVEQFERAVIAEALEQAGGVVAVAADKLQLGKATLYEKIKRYGLAAKGEGER